MSEPAAHLLLILLLLLFVFDGGGNVEASKQVALLENRLQTVAFSKLIHRRYSYRFAEDSENSSDIDSRSPSPAPEKKKRRNIKRWILGFFAGIVAGIISGVLASVIFRLCENFCRRPYEACCDLEIYSPLIRRADHLDFLDEGRFSSFEIVGRGASGEVYKAELPGSNGKLIAIKKIASSFRSENNEEDSRLYEKWTRQIRSEIQIVGQIRHRNLLPLLAHLPRTNCHYLIYEYMRNGSLQDALMQVSAGTRNLEWKIRHRIACGVAAGLEYLHHHSPRIIHRDLKPANILLDDDFEPKIADFGLAKALPEFDTHASTSNVVGTLGFIAPEFHQTLKFTDKCDVYSFGVVLASLVVGKLPSDPFFQQTEELSLMRWLRSLITSADPIRGIDQSMIGDGNEDEMILVLKVSCFCTVEDPLQRPSSKEVRRMLEQVRSVRAPKRDGPAE